MRTTSRFAAQHTGQGTPPADSTRERNDTQRRSIPTAPLARWAACAVFIVGALVWVAAPSLAAPEPRTVWEWRAADGMAAWQPNEQVANIQETSEAVSFDTTGGDPILVYQRPLSIKASAWQAFEIRLKAESSGQAEIFWTETTQGRYGGFSGEKSTRFGVTGDGTWRTYRVFPFWQAVGRIIKLRFDPYGGTRFSIAFIRVIEWPAPPAAAALRMPADASRLLPLHAVDATPTRGGLRLTQRSADGFCLAPVHAVVADERPCVSLRITSARERRAMLVFATDRSYGLQELAFTLIPDGRPHVYNLDVLQHPAWKGHVLAVGLRPGAGITLHALELADRPRGAAELRIQAFDVAEALPRVHRPVAFTARVVNAGGEAATGCRLLFELPQGAWFAGTKTRTSSRTLALPLPRLVYGQEHEATCRAVFPGPGTYRVAVRVQSQGRTMASAVCTLKVTPVPRVERTGYPPPPEPVRGKLDVGVYYFPGWRTAGQWSPITRFPERRPVLGWYREGDPSVADWHIKWAVEHGITFFAYDWYWSAGARSLEHALHEGLFQSRYRHYLKFCLLWANHNPPNTSSHEDFMAVVRYWLDHYFHRPEYYTIDGKPVVIIFSPYRFRADMGSEAVRRSFDAMREQCRQDGLPGLYLIACVGGDIGEVQAAAREGYDAVSAYNWPGLGVRGNEKEAPFADLIQPYREHWERIAATGLLPLMTPVSGGWDSRPWHGDTALVRSGRTPELFRRHLEDARTFIEAHPGSALPVALIEAWNEWGEGSYIEPHRQYGFGFLDAIRQVFTDAPATHTDLTPADVGHVPPEVNVAANLKGQWDLTNDAQGWDSGMNLAGFRIEDGALVAMTTSDDPAFFGPPIQVHAASARTLRLRMKLTAPAGSPNEDTAQVFWTTRSAPTSEEASVRFPVRLDGQWHEYRVTLATNIRWRGIITSLRLDPCNRSGIEVAFSRIALE